VNDLALRLPIEELEREMLKLPQAPAGVRHHFIAGLYIREVTIAADTYAIGHRHKVAHINVLRRGAVAMIAPDGSTFELRAPLMYVGAAGRKVGYIREAMTWLNVFPTDETDVTKLEGQLFEKSAAFDEAAAGLLTHDEVLQERQRLIGYDREDYQDWLAELGKSEDQLRASFNQDDDVIPFPAGTYKVKVAPSRLHGEGLIATDDIAAGELICAARIGDQRTPAGRFLNHARDPNARMVKQAQVIMLVAVRDIKGCRGGFAGEELTVNYRRAYAEAKS
jgi:SET domain-containing protein